jgi:hypothetical protein
MSYIVILMSFQTIYSINYGPTKSCVMILINLIKRNMNKTS